MLKKSNIDLTVFSSSCLVCERLLRPVLTSSYHRPFGQMRVKRITGLVDEWSLGRSSPQEGCSSRDPFTSAAVLSSSINNEHVPADCIEAARGIPQKIMQRSRVSLLAPISRSTLVFSLSRFLRFCLFFSCSTSSFSSMEAHLAFLLLCFLPSFLSSRCSSLPSFHSFSPFNSIFLLSSLPSFLDKNVQPLCIRR